MLEGVWRKGHKWVQPLWRTVWRFLKKLRTQLPSDPAAPLLGTHPEETRNERDTGTPAALFAVARTGKQPRCPLADEWIKKTWYIYTVEYYSATERNAFESVLVRRTNLEPMIQRVVCQKEKDKYCLLTHI